MTEGVVSDAFNEPPPIPINEWFYVDKGAKQGPVSSVTLKNLLLDKKIETDTQVWRKGMAEWKAIRQSDLEELVASVPPAIPSQLIGNGYVWTLATLPLIIGFIDASIAASNQTDLDTALIFGFGTPLHQISELPWQIPSLITATLGWLDYRRLRKAGYGSWWRRVLAVAVTPIYLFIRAKLLKQPPYYAITMIVTFILMVLIEASV